MIRVGVIGCGDIAVTAHFPALEKSDRVKIAAISTRRPDRLKALKERYQVPFGTTDYHELLNRDDVDAVIVCTPPWVTPQVVMEALEKGKDVLCEKPVAMTIGEARRMQETAERTGQKLMIGMTHHHDPILHKMKEWVQGGKIGFPVMYRVAVYDECWNPEGNPEHYHRIMETMEHGSPSIHEGSHIFDWLHVVSGAEIKSITSWGFKSRSEFPDSNYDITILDYENGDRAKIEIGWFLTHFPEYDFEAVGPLGIAAMNSHERYARLKTREATEEYVDGKEWWERDFGLQTSRFVDLVEKGGHCEPNIADAIYTMRATDGVRQSMKQGGTVYF